jgi:5-methylcytosine-specific restriction endonuclease McrA
MNSDRCPNCGKVCRKNSLENYGCCYDCSGNKKAKISPALREFIWRRDYGLNEVSKCKSCDKFIGKNGYHIAHIHAEAKGGDLDQGNLVAVCPKCNLEMGKMNLHDFMKLKNYKAPVETTFPMDWN